MAVCQNLVPLVNIKIAGKWMFIPLKMVLIGIDPYPYLVGGFNPSEQYEFVSWDDEIPNIWKNKIHVPNHLPDYHMVNILISIVMVND